MSFLTSTKGRMVLPRFVRGLGGNGSLMHFMVLVCCYQGSFPFLFFGQFGEKFGEKEMIVYFREHPPAVPEAMMLMLANWKTIRKKFVNLLLGNITRNREASMRCDTFNEKNH